MNIAVNALSVTTGGGRVSMMALIPELLRQQDGHAIIVIVSRHQEQLITQLPFECRRIILPSFLRNVLLRLAFEQVVLPIMLLVHRIDWLYSPGNQTVILAPCRVLLLMENPNPYSSLPLQWSRRERVRLQLLRIIGKLSFFRATKVRFLTKNSEAIITSAMKPLMRPTCIIPQGVSVSSVQERPARSEQRKRSSILFVSNLAPHKNIECLLRGFDLFVERSRFEGKLVIAGSNVYEGYANEIYRMANAHSSRDRIEFRGWVGREGMNSLFEDAEMFVFPSLEETFGMPVLEAMAHGVPVVASRAPKGYPALFLPFEEICGDAARYFDPFSPDDLAREMQFVHEHSAERRRLSSAGRERAMRFSWDIIARRLMEEFV